MTLEKCVKQIGAPFTVFTKLHLELNLHGQSVLPITRKLIEQDLLTFIRQTNIMMSMDILFERRLQDWTILCLDWQILSLFYKSPVVNIQVYILQKHILTYILFIFFMYLNK